MHFQSAEFHRREAKWVQFKRGNSMRTSNPWEAWDTSNHRRYSWFCPTYTVVLRLRINSWIKTMLLIWACCYETDYKITYVSFARVKIARPHTCGTWRINSTGRNDCIGRQEILSLKNVDTTRRKFIFLLPVPEPEKYNNDSKQMCKTKKKKKKKNLLRRVQSYQPSISTESPPV